jgi:c-di-GMP-binding flagellar brake protein YcgR
MRKRRKPTPMPSQPIPPAERGRLTTARGQQWTVRVTERDGDVLMLVLMVESEELDRGQIESLTLECTSDCGVARFEGEAVLEDHDLVRFRVRSSPTVRQRREFFRIRAPQPVVLAVAGSARIGNAYAVDVSGGGMLLSGPESLELDDKIRFRLHLDAETDPIRGLARVVRCAGDNQHALVFEQITKQDRERLIHFIFDRQRMELAKTRGEEERRPT